VPGANRRGQAIEGAARGPDEWDHFYGTTASTGGKALCAAAAHGVATRTFARRRRRGGTWRQSARPSGCEGAAKGTSRVGPLLWDHGVNRREGALRRRRSRTNHKELRSDGPDGAPGANRPGQAVEGAAKGTSRVGPLLWDHGVNRRGGPMRRRLARRDFEHRSGASRKSAGQPRIERRIQPKDGQIRR
jgi:hypothetical protein